MTLLQKNLKRLKMFCINVLLMIVATVLLVLFMGVGLVSAIGEILVTPATTVYFRDVALCLDITGNVVCQYLFNRTLITKKSKYYFGNVGETISSRLGYNEREGTLTWVGRALAAVLNWLDKDHCKKSIDLRFNTSGEAAVVQE